MDLTNREKYLLSFLITLVILIGGVLLCIIPVQSKRQELQINKLNQEQEISTMQSTIDLKSDTETLLDESKHAIIDRTGSISPPLTNDQFELFLNKLARRYSVQLVSSTYSEPKYHQPTVEGITSNINPLDLANISENTDMDKTDGVLKETSYNIIHKSIEIKIKGYPNRMKHYIDGLYTGGYKTLYVSSINIDYEDHSAIITLDMYSLPKVNWE